MQVLNSTINNTPLILNSIKAASINSNIHVIGFGSGLCNIMRQLATLKLPIQITHVKHIDNKNLIDLFNDYDTVYINEQDYTTHTISDYFKKIFKQNTVYICIAGLGSQGITSAFAPVVMHLKINNLQYHALCTLPFYFEGNWSNYQANLVLAKLNKVPCVQYIPLQTAIQSKTDMDIDSAFAQCDAMLIHRTLLLILQLSINYN